MFTFNSDALAQLFHETYHQAMSVRLVICSQEGLFLEFRNGLPGQLFYRKERIYALEYSGGSADPGVQVELNFGQISETYDLTVDDPAFFSPITAIDREITALRNEMELKRELSRNSVLTIIERENGRVNSNPQTQSDDNTDSRMNRLAVPESESK